MLSSLFLSMLLFGGSIVVSWLAQLGRGGRGWPREIS
jgi:hypothetical protein